MDFAGCINVEYGIQRVCDLPGLATHNTQGKLQEIEREREREMVF